MSLFARQQAVTSTASPKRIEPVIHHEANTDMNAYRGNDVHGVSRTATPHSPEEYDPRTHVHYTEPEKAQTPVPVRIVSQGGRELREWLVIREQAADVSRRIVGQQLERAKMTIQNLGTVPIWIGPDQSIAPFTGYRILPDAMKELTAQTDVWAVSNDGTPQNVAILVEFSEAVQSVSAVRPGL